MYIDITPSWTPLSIEELRRESLKAFYRKTELTPNCFPSCSDNKHIVDRLQKINPCIDITIFDIAMLCQGRTDDKVLKKIKESIIGLLKGKSKDNNVVDTELLKSLKNKESGLHAFSSFRDQFSESELVKGSNTEVGGRSKLQQYSDVYQIFDNIYGFWSLLSTSFLAQINNIPIASSPQIHTMQGAGYTSEQSIFKFIQSFISNEGLLASFLQFGSFGNVLNGLLNDVETIGSFWGWNPRVSPTFSFKEAFSGKPSLSVELKLINDSEDAANRNANFLNAIIKQSLIGTADAKKNGIIGNSFTGQWRAPNLFSVRLKLGNDDYGHVKTYHLCTLDSTVTIEGVLRYTGNSENKDNQIPDAYSVLLNFQSILPDTVDTWLDGAFPSLDSDLDNLYTSNGFETSTDYNSMSDEEKKAIDEAYYEDLFNNDIFNNEQPTETEEDLPWLEPPLNSGSSYNSMSTLQTQSENISRFNSEEFTPPYIGSASNSIPAAPTNVQLSFTSQSSHQIMGESLSTRSPAINTALSELNVGFNNSLNNVGGQDPINLSMTNPPLLGAVGSTTVNGIRIPTSAVTPEQAERAQNTYENRRLALASDRVP